MKGNKEDLIMLCVLAVAVIAGIILIVHVSQEKAVSDGARCESEGGEWVRTDRTHLCLRPGTVVHFGDKP
jgi:hypothetical protein